MRSRELRGASTTDDPFCYDPYFNTVELQGAKSYGVQRGILIALVSSFSPAHRVGVQNNSACMEERNGSGRLKICEKLYCI